LLTEQSSKNSYPTILVQKTQCLHHLLLLLQSQELSKVLDIELAELTTQIEEEEENC